MLGIIVASIIMTIFGSASYFANDNEFMGGYAVGGLVILFIAIVNMLMSGDIQINL